MKLKTINFNLILIIGILVTFSSCNGQVNSQTLKDTDTPIAIGKIVAEFDQAILHIFQDSKSDFWFSGKEKGVFYYDGESLRFFSKKDGLVEGGIIGFQEDALGNVFFETSNGVSKFDGQKFKTIEIKEDFATKKEWKLEPTDLWFRIGFNHNGPYRYDGEYLHYLEFPKAPQEDEFHSQRPEASFSPYGVYSIYKDHKGTVWFGTSGIGLCRFDGNSLRWHYEEQLQKTKSGGDFGMRSIFEDSNGFFWFNNTRYRYEILPNNEKEVNYLEYKKENGVGYINEENQIEFPYFMSMTEDNNGDLWMATYSDGVWRNNGKELLNYPVKDGETEVLLFSIYKDKQGTLWLGTHNAGVYKFNGKSFMKFEP